MRPTLLTALLLTSLPSLAQSVAVDVNPFGGRVTITPPSHQATTVTVRTEEVSGDGFHIAYRQSDRGRTELEIVEPQGALASLWEGTFLIAEDDVPTSARVRGGRWYRLVVTRADGSVFERKLQAKAGMVGTVRVYGFAAPPPQHVAQPVPPPPPAGPYAISPVDFGRLKAAIDAESFSDSKLDVLRTAAADAWFTCDQVGELVELFDFANDKVEAVATVRGHLVDRQNAFTLYERFTFTNDKEKVRRLLSAR